MNLAYPTTLKIFIAHNLLGNDIILNHIEVQKVNPFTIKNFTNSRFRLIMSMRNKQPFDFKIEKIELSLKSKKTNRVVLEGVLDTIIDAPKLQTIKIPLDVEAEQLQFNTKIGKCFF